MNLANATSDNWFQPDRSAIREILTKNSKTLAAGLGIEIVDVQVMRIDLPPEVSTSVFRRMEAERERVAREFRSQGAEAAERIKANADRHVLLRWPMHFGTRKNCVVRAMPYPQIFTPRLMGQILNFLLLFAA